MLVKNNSFCPDQIPRYIVVQNAIFIIITISQVLATMKIYEVVQMSAMRLFNKDVVDTLNVLLKAEEEIRNEVFECL